MTPRRSSSGACGHLVREQQGVRRVHPGPRLLVVEGDLDQHPEAAPCRVGAPLQRISEPGPVHGMHHVGIPGHRRRLVGLQLADEVDAELVTVAQLGDLGGGLLVPVLPHVTDPELREQVDVTGREELRDGDELDLLGAASRVGAGTLDARPHGGEPGGKLVRASVTRLTSWTTPAKRPVWPSRR